MSPWCPFLPLKLFTKLQVCKQSSFVLYLYMFNETYKNWIWKKNIAFLSCQSLNSVGWHNLKWISNNLLVASVPYSPRCLLNVAFPNESDSNCKILDVLYFAFSIWILSQQCLPCYLKYITIYIPIIYFLAFNQGYVLLHICNFFFFCFY